MLDAAPPILMPFAPAPSPMLIAVLIPSPPPMEISVTVVEAVSPREINPVWAVPPIIMVPEVVAAPMLYREVAAPLTVKSSPTVKAMSPAVAPVAVKLTAPAAAETARSPADRDHAEVAAPVKVRAASDETVVVVMVNAAKAAVAVNANAKHRTATIKAFCLLIFLKFII